LEESRTSVDPTLENALAFEAGHDAKFWGMQP